MNQDREHLRLLAIFHYVITGVAALFTFSPLLYSGRRHLHICRATRHTKTRRRVAARISRLDFYRDRLAIVFAGDCDRDLHFDRRSLIGEASSLLVCIRDCMRRMPLIRFGTILGVFTIIVLLRESVKALFAATQTSV